MRLLVAAVVLGVSATASADADRVLRGTVIDEHTREPIEGALVIAQHEKVVTDENGAFAVVVGDGERFLLVSAPGYAIRSVAVASASQVELVVSNEVIEIEGTAPRPHVWRPPPRLSVTPAPAAPSYRLSVDDLRTLPGTANDALRAVQVLPGVARLPYSFGGIVLRGTSPRDNAVYIDGIEVPIAFHFGGISSFYPSSLLEGITVSNGGIDAAYGRAQGGMVEMTTREPRGDHWRTAGSVGLLDTSVVVEGPARGGAVFIGVRRSYLDVVLDPFVDAYTPLPSYLDAQLKGSWGNPDFTGRIQPMIFLASDQLDAIEQKADREDESSISSFFIRLAAPYDRRWGTLSLRIVPWLGIDKLDFTSRVNNVLEKFVRPSDRGGLRTELARVTDWGHLRGGLDLQTGHLGHFQAGLGHKGDILDQVNGETTIDWLDLALWGETRFFLGRLDVKPGVRLERYGISDEEVLDPRLALALPLSEVWTLREAMGRYHQPPTPGDIDPNGGNPRLDSSYFDSVSLGIEARDDGLSASLTGFYSDGERLGVRTQPRKDFENLGSLGPTFAQLLEKQLGLAFYRENIGRARNYGLELLLRNTSRDGFWLVSYTLARAQRYDGALSSYAWRAFDLDQRHNLNLAGSLNLGRWRVGGRVQIVSGTPIASPLPDTLPTFFQLDARVDRIWRRFWGLVDLYFDIQNLTNHRNVEGRDVDEFGMESELRGLPLLPFIGVEFVPD